MRAFEGILQPATKNWASLPLLVSGTAFLENKTVVGKLWREALVRPPNQSTKSQLKRALDDAEVETSQFEIQPDLLADQSYCPICQTVYESGTEACRDCENFPLSAS